MKKQETAQFLAVVKTAFPHFEITEPVVHLWHEYLEPIPFDQAKKNLQEHIRSNRFPPTIADIVRLEPNSTLHIDQLRLETAERFALMDEWERNAVPIPEWIGEKWGKK
ncbi:replicative helicase loader/inhibitor [Paenibacillus harenae]|uniref:replicative helicase loader/inhibitor n=1 Tax=Paenibacillus harenae TaxID=306543 RepID=UPI00048F8536|nr:replicative helicase loader/inhibitor [Paenibacillus harenae]